MNNIEQHPLYNEVREAYADCAMLEDAVQEAECFSIAHGQEGVQDAEIIELERRFMERRNLRYRASQAVDKQTAKALLEKAVPGYNKFTPNKLDHLPDNCEVTIAREGSVCLYVKGNNLPINDLALIADECGFKNDELRLWWD
jgi:hypothetical protein